MSKPRDQVARLRKETQARLSKGANDDYVPNGSIIAQA